MRGVPAHLTQRNRLGPPARLAVQAGHPLAPGLRHAWVPEATRGEDRLFNLAFIGDENPEAGFTGVAPVWTTGTTGPVLSFDGTSRQLVHTGAPSMLWNPFTMGGVAYTIAFIGRIKSHPGGGRVLYSHNCSTSGVVSLELSASATDLRLYATQDSLGGESIGVSTSAVPGVGNLFAVIATIRDTAVSAIAVRDYQNGARALATDGTGNISTLFVNAIDQESFCSWHGNGTASAFADADMSGAFGWNRAFSDAEMQAFLDDPFGVVRVPAGPKWAALDGATAPGALLTETWSLTSPTVSTPWVFSDSAMLFSTSSYTFDGGATAATGATGPGATLTTSWTIWPGALAWDFSNASATFGNPVYTFDGSPNGAGGIATASSLATGTTLTETWSLTAQAVVGSAIVTERWSLSAVGTATGVATASGAILTEQWFLLSGSAVVPGTATGATLTETWSVAAGTASGSGAPVAGVTLTEVWSLSTVGAATGIPRPPPPPIPFIGGGGMGPGGDPATAARIRASAERAAEKAYDPVGWSQRQSAEAARAMREALQAETERTRPERVKRSTLRFLNLTDED